MGRYKRKPEREIKCANPECRVDIVTTRSKRRFCSDVCRWETWNKAHPRVGKPYCGYCDEYTDHTTRDCVLPIVN